jgi:hypothetical protein
MMDDEGPLSCCLFARIVALQDFRPLRRYDLCTDYLERMIKKSFLL